MPSRDDHARSHGEGETARFFAFAGTLTPRARRVGVLGSALAVATLLAPRPLAYAGEDAPDAASKAPHAPHAPHAWCAPETEALADSVCAFEGPSPGGRRTLVVFLHGLVPRDAGWQWTQQRAILREAKLFGFTAIMPRAPGIGPRAAAGYAWPGLTARAPEEDALVDEWSRARRTLEARAGRPFDEVFVLGFSSGAYFATSLALRGRLDVDGYVVLAGGSAARLASDPPRRAPVFIGVSAQDRASAPGARALGQLLASRGWPHRVDEEPVGHTVSDRHVAHALAYLRSLARAHAHAEVGEGQGGADVPPG